jgi:cytochrome c556
MLHRSSTSRRIDPASFTLGLAVLACLAGALVLPARVSQAQAASDQPSIEYRQLVMGAIGSNMGAIGGIMKNQLALPGAVANHAQQMADAAKLIAPAFKQKVTAGKTDARPEIWSDWAKFEQAAADYGKAAANLATAANGSDPAAVGLAVRALGESCGGCHDSFRKPKEESYKNR